MRFAGIFRAPFGQADVCPDVCNFGAMPRIVIKARRAWLDFKWRELYDFRELLLLMAHRDLKVRYAQTFIGILWGVLQPLTTLLVFTFVFQRVVRIDTSPTPYPLFFLSGWCAWAFFALVLKEAGQSLISNAHILQKIYFPRVIVPVSKIYAAGAEMGIALVFVLGLMAWYGQPPAWKLLALPVFILLNVLTALGAGLWVSAMTIRYRDILHVVPFVVQVGLYASPVAYPSSLAPEAFRTAYFLNPMAGMIEGFRWALIADYPLAPQVWLSVAVGLVLFLSGYLYFNYVERLMADYL